jgi:hypothetical protein
MKKIPTIFLRDPAMPSLVTPEWARSCWWVQEGEGTPTIKFDGTACLIKEGNLHKRRTIKRGDPKPEGFIVAGTSEKKIEGWLPCKRSDPADQYHWEAFDRLLEWVDGTYELCGPNIQGNPERMVRNELVPHGMTELGDFERSYQSIRQFLQTRVIEGIVWHHEDGRMAKIKRRDFGFAWPLSTGTIL